MSLNILVVEDDRPIAEGLTGGLREEGYCVEHAADGDEAQRCLQAKSWDVVLLDWRLPKVDGLTVLKQYREQGGTARVVLLTARDAVADRICGLDSGADDYVCKPFSFDELLARVRSLARRQDTPRNIAVGIDDVQLDFRCNQAHRAGKRLELTAKEHSLLVYFLHNPGKVLSREQIYEHIWNEHYDGTSNTLEVHIMELRRKLEAHGPRLIFTVRGRGYVMQKQATAEQEPK